jgi:hypothetical protein
MGTMLDMVYEFLQQDEWNPRRMGEQPIFSGRVNADNGNWLYFAQVREEQEQVIFYSVLQTFIPEDRRSAVAEFMTRVNYNLLMGNFEMDFEDGQVRFRTSIDVEGGQLTPIMVRNLAYTNVAVMNRYLPGVLEVAFDRVLPGEALARAEADSGSPDGDDVDDG